ncbi:bifunctional glycosyltransferase family 2/GtrA family protein [Actinomyces sp. 2119]|uniref:bifunctional glycosyltransferase family 2/GtrA family protein n=1 Tax=Actinomyces sp. 2119 TaxID=2321393 RepID=UPI002175E6A1|nr:bifunctional glycosyltransferase family 2/GtrA family protein [Actinomyces sp. 2119]
MAATTMTTTTPALVPTSPCTTPRTSPQQAAAGLPAASPQPGQHPRLQDPQRDPRPEGEQTPVATLVVLIPAYRPDRRLPDLVRQVLHRCSGCAVLVVDDGSGPDYAEVFATVRSHGAHVVTLARNRGKGEALRSGLARACDLWPQADVVCADADGQHKPEDIADVASRVRHSRHMTLGVRRFRGPVPLRSRVGNTVTSLLLRAVTGWRLHDTQTGLRGYPAGQLAWLQQVGGNRYEYELALLLRAHRLGLDVEQVEIATVYEPGNTSSHFRPLRDSFRVYAPLLAFTATSLAGFCIDWLVVVVLHALTGRLLGPVVAARLISATANYLMNRRVFGAGQATTRSTVARYAVLACSLVAASYLLLLALTGIGIPLGLAKVLTDSTVYVTSYLAQRHLVFGHPPTGGAPRQPGHVRRKESATSMRQ